MDCSTGLLKLSIILKLQQIYRTMTLVDTMISDGGMRWVRQDAISSETSTFMFRCSHIKWLYCHTDVQTRHTLCATKFIYNTQAHGQR